MRKIRFGVLGAAKIAREKVIPAMQKGALTEVVALASRDLDKAKAAAGPLGIGRAYGSYAEMLADPEIDAVYNPLPNHLHVPLTLQAMEAGKHVLCEKPIALTADEATKLVDAEARTGKRAVEAFATRHHPQWKRLREIVREGIVGEARLVLGSFTYNNRDPANVRNKADIGGGGLYDIGCYPIVGARYVFEAEPTRVIASFDLDPAFGTDRLASAILEFSGGRKAVFTSATQLAAHQGFRVVGDKAFAALKVPYNPRPDWTTEIIIDDCRDLLGGGARVETLPPVDQYTEQGDAFARGILGLEPIAHPISDAVLNMRIIDALFRSGKSGRWEAP